MYKFRCFLSLPIPNAPGANVVCSLTEASELAKKGELKSGQQLLKEVRNLQMTRYQKYPKMIKCQISGRLRYRSIAFK